MKRIFLLIALVLGLIATKVNAQQQPVRFGLKAGANLATWQGETVNSTRQLINFADGSVSHKMREGFHVGAYLSIPLARGFELEPGLQYAQKGTRLTGRLPIEQAGFLNANTTITNKAVYLDIPLVAKVYVGEGFHFFVGPQLSYLLSNKVQTEAGALGFKVLNQEWDMKGGFRELDLALTGGIGYRFTSGFNISAGYDYGLNTIDQNGSFDTFNRVAKASIGYTF